METMLENQVLLTCISRNDNWENYTGLYKTQQLYSFLSFMGINSKKINFWQLLNKAS